ncbi:MAG: WD40/YVTN/BNR-like repeat-containing protein [Pyrinomonadaceae bacterium]
MKTKKTAPPRRGKTISRTKAATRETKSAAETLAPTDIDPPAQEGLISGQIKPQSSLTAGPRKERADEPYAPRLSNHKARSVWFQNRASWPVREAPTRSLVRERDMIRKTLPQAPGGGEWMSIGPTNIGGRLTSLVCHPNHAERLWAGAAGGGVWYSPDAGQSWQSQWHNEDILNVGALAIDPEDPRTVYCGTGEANLSADSYPGVGLYRTVDGGATWQLHAFAEKTLIPQRIGVIAIDPFNPQHLRLGGVGYAEMGGGANDLGGMYFSLDAGVTWKRETFVTDKNYWCHSIVFHPAKKGVIYATFTARGARNGIYQSTDGGKSWKQLLKGLPPAERIGRTAIAISPSDPEVLYAFAADEAADSADHLLGVFRSSNGGAKWLNVAGTHFAKEGQISYGNAIAVHPANPNHVICGGVDLHLSTDGGKSWAKATKWNVDRGDSNYAHADHHCLLMPAAKAGRIYDANDGGLDISEDGGLMWINRSSGLAVTMYYDMDVAQSDERVFGGGAQDNGTLITNTGGSNDHYELMGGDGGWIVFDPVDAGHVYASSQNMGIYRFRAGKYDNVTPPADKDERNFVWMCYIAMDFNDRRTVFTGSYRVWRTRDDGDNWSAVSGALDTSPISAIEIAPADSRRIYVGTLNGKFFRSLDGGDTWSANMASTDLPGYSLTRLATHPQNADTVYATVANFGHSHIYRSKDGGANWEDIDKGRLPDVPHHSMVIPPDSPEMIYVCNDAGVFVSPDAGATWMNLTRNLPAVTVVDLAYHHGEGTLSAATYGRSLWRLRIKQV